MKSDDILVGAIDEGTSSTRFMIFSARNAELVTYHQIAIKKHCPKQDWVEQDPIEILNAVIETIDVTVSKLETLGYSIDQIKAVGLTNQRETVVAWDKFSGKPLYNAIVWLDSRTTEIVDRIMTEKKCDKNVLFEKTGLPLSPYFSALKIQWLMQNNSDVAKAIVNHSCLFGTIDTWLIWNLTGGVKNGLHLTDVTNASRTLLMNLRALSWDQELCDFFQIPMETLPQIKSCSEIYGYLKVSALVNIPISGCLGDQQSALLGQNCYERGQAKCTFGTGCFLLYNIGPNIVKNFNSKKSSNGLLTTVGFKLHPSDPTIYALEGSISVAGAVVQWLCDNMQILDNAKECARVANTVNDTNDLYFVPAFTGLYAPYWRDDARSIMCGLNNNTKAGHIVRAALEAICFQVRDIVDSMNSESGAELNKLLVDGGMTENELLMQLLADLCGVQITRPIMAESSALGAAMAAGYAEGIDCWELTTKPPFSNDVYFPLISSSDRNIRHQKWQMAIVRSLNWVHTDSNFKSNQKLLKGLKGVSDLPEFLNENHISDGKVFVENGAKWLPASLFLCTNFLLIILKDYYKL